MEGGLHLRPHQDQDGSEVAQDANNANQGHQHLGEKYQFHYFIHRVLVDVMFGPLLLAMF